MAEARELHVHAGYLSQILSDLTYDLGSPVAARVWAADSHQLAESARHNELWAWAADSLAMAFRLTRKPEDMIGAARKGLRRVPRRNPLVVQLHARAAEGYAHKGDRSACIEQLALARRAFDKLPAEMTSRQFKSTAEQANARLAAKAAHAYVALEDWGEARREARTALGIASWSLNRAAGAHLDLAVALAQLGSPEEAAGHGQQAIASGRADHGSSLQRARRLDDVLTSRYPHEPSTKDFHEQYQQLASHAITNS